jgi:hypothetical protein
MMMKMMIKIIIFERLLTLFEKIRPCSPGADLFIRDRMENQPSFQKENMDNRSFNLYLMSISRGIPFRENAVQNS